MDCHVALDLLEMARCDSDDLDQAELADAGVHVTLCEQCAAVYRDRRQLDRGIGRAMRDVAVPADLKQRIHRALTEAAEEAAVAADIGGRSVLDAAAVEESAVVNASTSGVRRADPPADVSTVSRRTWLRIVLPLSACVIASVAVWQFWTPGDVRLSLEELQGKTEIDLRRLSSFDGRFSAELPFGWDTNRSLLFDATAKGFSATGSKPHAVALYGYSFRVSRLRTLHGVLLVLPKPSLSNPPEAPSLGSANITYQRRGRQRFATAGWTEGDLVYVIFVQGGANHLEEIQERLRIQPT